MKVSLNFANQVSDVKVFNGDLDDLVKKIGLQLGAIEDIDNWSERFKSATIVEVVECIKHPNADKLSLCKVNDNNVIPDVQRDENGYIQVVCGAPNVSKGILAVWLPPKSIVPSTFKSSEPMMLEAREIRGQLSSGMLASPQELGIEGGHEGLLILDNGFPGQSFSESYSLNDIIIDLENKMFTHRPDCFGVLGVARELAGIQELKFTSPEWYLNRPRFEDINNNEFLLNVSVETDLVPRLMAVVMNNITVEQSPRDIQSLLTLSGIKPINNIVDITNYISLLTAQPLHAYDYDKLKSLSEDKIPVLKARLSKPNEFLTLLGSKKIELKDNQSVVIASDNKAVGLGGVMGGMETEVDSNTKNIVIECATFDMYNIRKTSMKYGLFTDAVTRFNKGQSPLQNDRVLLKAMQMVEIIAGGKQASKVHDVIKPDLDLDAPRLTHVSTLAINSILGRNFTPDEISKILNNVEIKTLKTDDDTLTLEIPFWRQDISLADNGDGSLVKSIANADIAEEVGRLFGYNKLPVDLPVKKLYVTKKNNLVAFKEQIRSILVSSGANELLTYSFVSSNLIRKMEQNESKAFKINNALSPILEYYRMSLLPSLLEKIHPNIKSGFNEFSLFELGKIHNKDDFEEHENLPKEREVLALVLTDKRINLEDISGPPFYWAKKYLDSLLDRLNIDVEYKEFDSNDDNSQQAKIFYKNRSAKIYSNNKIIGYIGEFRKNIHNNLKLPQYTAGFEIDVSDLMKSISGKSFYIPVPRYPKVEQDVTLKVEDKVNYSTLRTMILDTMNLIKAQDTDFVLEIIDIYVPENNNSTNYTFRFKVFNKHGTLSSQEVNDLLDLMAIKLGEKIKVSRV